MTAPTIAVLVHDGFYSCGTGAGRSNRAFLEVLTGLLRPGVRLVLMPVHLTLASSEYNLSWHQAMHDLVHRAAGTVIPVDNGTDGLVRFGGLAEFQHACAAAAQTLGRHIAPAAGPLLTIAFDCPFFGLAPMLHPPIRTGLVNVARSTGALHAPEDQARIRWERDGLHTAVAAGGRVAAISGHMSTHLAVDYQIPAGAILDLFNGLTTSDWTRIEPPDTRLLPTPARRGFVLAVGRAMPYKGFDDLLDALTLLKHNGTVVPHTILAAVTDTPQPAPHQQHLAERISSERLDVTLIGRFTPALRSLLTHPALAALVVPSRVEPFGRIPLEAFVAGAAPVVATTAGGLAELITDRTGYPAAPANPQSLAAALTRALAIGPAERAKLRAAGRHLAATRYNHQATTRRFMADIAPWAIRGPQSQDTAT